ncbi:MAG: MoaD/ThiS family protein [Limisphaerales bacterium]
MKITVTFHSYFRELTGCAHVEEELAEGTRLAELLARMQERFPKIKSMERSTLKAVGLEYQSGEYVLREGDEVSLFPPVQGG